MASGSSAFIIAENSFSANKYCSIIPAKNKCLLDPIHSEPSTARLNPVIHRLFKLLLSLAVFNFSSLEETYKGTSVEGEMILFFTAIECVCGNSKDDEADPLFRRDTMKHIPWESKQIPNVINSISLVFIL